MRQIFQSFGTGAISVVSVPSPAVAPGRILIQTECSLISAGTERMLVGFGRGSLLRKVRSQPEKVRQVLAKIRTDGLVPTLKAVRNKLSDPTALGYSQAGRIVAVGAGVHGFRIGDRVASNGPHAEQVVVPANLCARIPEGVSAEAAAFTVVGAIALQGIRLLNPTLGETAAVMGLGLIGQLAVQMLLAQGCRVLAIDLDADKVALAEAAGAQGCLLGPGRDPLAAAEAFAGPVGLDGVLITASTTSNEPIEQAAALCRQRGRIVLVGVVGLAIPRDLFYRKELSFQVSCSYGPGRYDPAYEEGGHDYPRGLVRWTEQRNFEAVLELLRRGTLRTESLQNGLYPVERAPEAYDALMARHDLLGLLITYPAPEASQARVVLAPERTITRITPAPLGLGIIGAGNYLKATLLPLLDACPPHRRVVIASRQGASATLAARRFGFAEATSDATTLLADPRVDAVVIATRHDSHADLTIRALEAGKHVFVEKPLATREADLDRVEAALQAHPGLNLMVGFNRRLAPMSIALLRQLQGRRSPLHVTCTINAGALPDDHWTTSLEEGGGRILGEGCHFVDLMRHWAGSPIVAAHTLRARRPGAGASIEDIATVSLTFEDGSLGILHYLSNGHRGFPKEEYTLFWEGRQARLTNFKRLEYWGVAAPDLRHRWSQDKGHEATLHQWLEGCADPALRVPLDTLLEVSRWSIRAADLGA
jgi:predicted dehydrogenase/threonine dehydrogenase-like Zn-dependent dehydrogenase